MNIISLSISFVSVIYTRLSGPRSAEASVAALSSDCKHVFSIHRALKNATDRCKH
jgi:hypothetical protein